MKREFERISRFAPYVSALLFNIPLVYLRLYDSSYDAFTHLFFASHYQGSWFSIWNTKWYGGFLVTGYTPLSHQLMALISPIAGLNYSFGVLALTTLILLIWSANRLSSALGLYSRSLPWLIGFSPSFYLFVYVFGQLPGVLSTTFLLAGASYLMDYIGHDTSIKGTGKKRLILAVLLSSLSFFTHHLAFLLTSPVILLSLAHGASLRRAVKAFVALIALTSLIISPILFEIIRFVNSTPAQAPIWHITRGNLVVGMTSFTFLWGIYGPLLPLLPLPFVVLYEQRKWAVGTLAAFYIIFGLGGSTPLPKLILGDGLFNFLTYEKFSLIAVLLLLIPLSYYLDNRLVQDYGVRWAKWLRVGVVLSFLLACCLVIFLSQVSPIQPPSPNIREIASYLNSQEGRGFYITLGLGCWSRELSILSIHPTLDGGFNTARRLSLLAESGVESIDAAKYFPGGLELVNRILRGGYGVRWVVLGDESYIPLLVSSGFVKVKDIHGTLPVTIWEITKQGYENEFDDILTDSNLSSYPWGLLPLLTTLLTGVLSIKWMKLN